MTEPWPISAVATKILKDGRIRPADLLPLAYKELVLIGAVALRTSPATRFHRTTTHMALREGARTPWYELNELLASLHRHAAQGGRVDHVVHRLGAKDPSLAKRIAASACRGLMLQGLVVADDHRLFGVTVRRRLAATPAGEVLRTELVERVASAAEDVGSVLPPSLLLVLDRHQRTEIDRAFKNAGADGSFSVNLSGFDSLSCFDTACHDSGGHGGDGGQDGGGGGD